MELKDFKKLGTFSSKVKDDSLIQCALCDGWFGIAKWLRRATAVGARCPRCETLFDEEQIFQVKPAVKLPEPEPEKETEDEEPEKKVIVNPDGTKTYREIGLEVTVNARSKSD